MSHSGQQLQRELPHRQLYWLKPTARLLMLRVAFACLVWEDVGSVEVISIGDSWGASFFISSYCSIALRGRHCLHSRTAIETTRNG